MNEAAFSNTKSGLPVATTVKKTALLSISIIGLVLIGDIVARCGPPT